jgi:protein-tyrosine phosphatase
MMKDVLRKFMPNSLLHQRDIVLRLGPRAGWIYVKLRLLDVLGFRGRNGRVAPAGARSFLFVCFGNIMRSAMAEFLMRKMVLETTPDFASGLRIVSAGLHAAAGREAHPWAQEAAVELGISLAGHRAKPLIREMVEQADCIFAMDFQNKAELLTLFPEAESRIYMLSAYAKDAGRGREIPDPYTSDLEGTRGCGRRLRTCVGNLIAAQFAAEAANAAPHKLTVQR